MKKYIVSGINGNVGSLLKNKEISVYDKSLKIKNEKIFIHLASKSRGTFKDIIQSNIDFLLEVIEFCKKNGIKNFIFFSAFSIYTKDDIYSTSKLLGEKILEQSDLKVLVLRLPMILTQDSQDGILNRIINKLEANEDLIITGKNKKFNNFIGIKDIFSFIDQYTFKEKYNLINLGSSKEYTLIEIILFLKKTLKSKSNIISQTRGTNNKNISVKSLEKKYQYKQIKVKKLLKNWLKNRK